MRKIFVYAAAAALVTFVSCQKEAQIGNGTGLKESPVFTASIAGAAKTTLNLTDGKLAWEEADEITVKDASNNTAVYRIESIDPETGHATFVIKDGQSALGDGPYTATYGTEPSAAQTYDASAGRLYMTAAQTSDNSLTFSVQCSLMKINLTKPGESVKSIAVTGVPAGREESTYTLTCAPAENITSAKDFCIALPAGSYSRIEITNASNAVCTLNASGVSVAVNHIMPVTLGAGKLNFALPGVFSVSDTRKVRFSQGNLWADESKALHFESRQSEYRNTYDLSHVSHFTWSDNIASAVDADYGGSNLFCDKDHPVSVDGSGAVYYTLSKDEWLYLFRNHSFKWVTVQGKNGCVLAPDGFDGTIEDSYDDEAGLAESNLVFLPAAGCRIGTGVLFADKDTYCWSSSISSADPYYANCAYFSIRTGSESEICTEMDRIYALSLRLVTDVK